MNIWQDLMLPGIAKRGELSAMRDVEGDDTDPLPLASRDADAEGSAQPGRFPLTDVQRAYWLGRSGDFELGNVGCHIYIEFVIARAGLPEVERAWQRLILRHRMLRAVIRDDGFQEFLDDAPIYRMTHLDLTEAPDAAAQAMLHAVRAEMSHRVFSPDTWPLFDVRTSATSAQALIHFSIDLLVADFWSLQVLLGELALLILHPQTELAPLTMDFRDYRLALAARRNSVREERAERYWLDRLDRLPDGPRLPLARKPGSIPHPVFERRNAVLEPDLWPALKRRAKAAGLTPSGVLMAAFSRVLAVWSETEHFTLNVTLFNRALLDERVYNIVGDFTSLLLLEVREDRGIGFADFARRLATQFRTDLRHRGYDGVRLLQELAKKNGPERRTAMPVVFTSALSNGMPGLDSTEEAGSVAYGVSQTPQVWIDHQVYERGGRLFLSWDVVEALFPAALIDDMFGAYERLLRRLAVDDDAWTQPDIDLLPEAQSRRLREVNQTNAPVPDGLLHQPFFAQSRARPDHLAIIAWKRRLTYAELAHQARSLAARLRDLGAGPGHLVAVAMEKGWEQIVAALAILETGAAFLPIDPGWPEERRLHLLAEGGVGIVVTQPCLLDGLSLPAPIVGIGLAWQPLGEVRAVEPAPAAAQGGSDLAYVIFTSGSTGEPKGVMIEHRSALNTVLDINARFGICPADRILALSALSFDLSIYDIFGTLAAGATLVLPHPSSAHAPDDWDRLIQRERVTVWNSVPALHQVWLDHLEGRGRPAIRSLRLILLSGDWIPVGLPDRARAVSPAARIVSLGGATEAAIWSVVHEIGRVDPEWTSIPYGTPLRNQRLRVLDGRGRSCAPWVKGEIGISGIGLARGYLNDSARTDAKFVACDVLGERIYRTGDMGCCRPDGTIEFLGRTDQQVKLNGYRIELGEIESVLGRHAQVGQVAVTLERTATGGRLTAFVVGQGISVEALAAEARGWLPGYMVPTVWHLLPELPLTRNGKVDRSALAPLVPPIAAGGRAGAVPIAQAGDVSAEVLSIVSQALAMPELRPADNLLAAGATSLDLVRVAGQIERRFGFRPSFPAFFADPTVAALSRAVGEQALGSPATGGTRTAPAHAPAHALIVDPGSRETFRRQQQGLRACPENWGGIALPRDGGAVSVGRQVRRTVRSFAAEAVPLSLFGPWFAALSRFVAEGVAGYAFGSAGATYSVQTYLHVKAEGVEGCPAGTFYYHPVRHALVPLTLGVGLDPDVHEPFTNRPAFESARFSLFFVSRPAAIVPLYGEMAERLAPLEAGAMAQVLEAAAGTFGIGLCAVGWLDFPAIRHLFLLEDDQQLLHAHVGGLRESSDAGEFEEGVV